MPLKVLVILRLQEVAADHEVGAFVQAEDPHLVARRRDRVEAGLQQALLVDHLVRRGEHGVFTLPVGPQPPLYLERAFVQQDRLPDSEPGRRPGRR